jgi:hypothetical protein
MNIEGGRQDYKEGEVDRQRGNKVWILDKLDLDEEKKTQCMGGA